VENKEPTEMMEKVNALILYFSEVQIRLMSTRKVARDYEDHALAVASAKAGNGISEVIDILQSYFESAEREAGVMHIPIEDKRPHLKIVGGTTHEKKD